MNPWLVLENAARCRGLSRLGATARTLVLVGSVVGLAACDEDSSEAAAVLEDGTTTVSLSTLLRSPESPTGSEVDYWIETVDRELSYAESLEVYWTESIRDAVRTASAARVRAEEAEGIAREAAAAEAREVLDAVAWTEWTSALIACVDDRISPEDVARARDSRSGADAAWVAKVRRADRLRKGAGEAMREEDPRRSLRRAFYACELASQIAGEPLGVG